jgi:hypothetical protein
VIESIIAGVSDFAAGACCEAGNIDESIVCVIALGCAAEALVLEDACSGAAVGVLSLRVAPGSCEADEAVAVVAGSGASSWIVANPLGGGAGIAPSVFCFFVIRAISSVALDGMAEDLRLACSGSVSGMIGTGRVGRGDGGLLTPCIDARLAGTIPGYA